MDPSWAWRRSSSIAARCVSYHYAQLVWVDVCHNWFYHIKKDHQKNQVFWWPIGRYTIRQPCLEPSPRFQEIHEDTHQSIIWFGDELLASELTLEAYFSLSLFNIGVLRHGSSHLNLSINKLFGWRISIATFDSTSLYVVCFAWFHVKDPKKKKMMTNKTHQCFHGFSERNSSLTIQAWEIHSCRACTIFFWMGDMETKSHI